MIQLSSIYSFLASFQERYAALVLVSSSLQDSLSLPLFCLTLLLAFVVTYPPCRHNPHSIKSLSLSHS